MVAVAAPAARGRSAEGGGKELVGARRRRVVVTGAEAVATHRVFCSNRLTPR